VPTAFLLAAAIVWIFRLLSNDQARQRSLREANEVNKMLVRDTHHRVKNNLQAIMSMVRMHALPDELKLDLQSRIAAMSAVHEHLYRLDQFSEVRAATLIPGIVDPIKAGYGSGVEVSYDIADLQVDHDHATPLALLISELATNVFKYAFPDGTPGRLSITLTPSGENGAKLVVADNGVGLQKGSGAGLGGKLIRAMLIQLGGRGSYADAPGTVFEAELGMGFKPAMAAPEDA
jgi:two-component sensor histidine kinase